MEIYSSRDRSLVTIGSPRVTLCSITKLKLSTFYSKIMSTLHFSFFLWPPAIQSQSQSVYLLFKVLRGTDTECWAGFYSLSPHIVAPAPCWRDSGSRDSGTIIGAGAGCWVGQPGEPCPEPGPASRKRRVTTVRKISLVAPQQPLKQQRRTHGQWELSDYCSSNSESLHT